MRELLRGLTSKDIRSNPDFYKITPDNKALSQTVDKLEETVFGQHRACTEVARAIIRVEAGMRDPQRPEFVGFFLGGTGVGKTAMGRAIARVYHPNEPDKYLTVIDCSNFKHQADTAKLTGAPPGYVGYGDKPLLIPGKLEKRNVVVFDEIEKADSSLHQVLLSVIDGGRLQVPIGTSTFQNVKNVELNFTNSTILFTSNVGAESIHKEKQGRGKIGFKTGDQVKPDLVGVGLAALKERFRHMPEFLGRIDAIVVFDDLTPEVYEKIFSKFVEELNNHQTMGQNYLAVTSELRSWIIAHTQTEYGARDLKRAMNKHLITKAAEIKLLLPSGVPLVADIEDEEVIFWTTDLKEEPKEETQIAVFSEKTSKTLTT